MTEVTTDKQYVAQVPTAQYAYIQIQSDNLDEVVDFHNKLSPSKITTGDEDYVEMETWNGKKLLYNDETHMYKTIDGKKMLSGSAYGKKFEKDFPRDQIAGASSKKHDVAVEDVLGQWDMSGQISRDFGSAVHLGMEYYFKYRLNGCFKLPNHKVINEIVSTCPVFEDSRSAVPEAMVAETNLLHCGVIDLILINDDDTISLYDYKTSYNIKKSLPQYNAQLNFYRNLLEADGFTVKDMALLNYDGEWETIEVAREEVEE
jgi:ATP-dependent exoDNAse (exonuclease V) beta subunit